MTSPRQTRKPAFLWQAGLILLPVVIIAVVALASIIQNRTEVEREARRQAEEVARQYSKELERSWGGLLTWQEFYAGLWNNHLVNGVGAWPGSDQRTQWEAAAARSPALSPQAQLTECQAQYPGLRPENVFPNRFTLLRLMAESPGEPVSRERFLDIVWDYTAFPTTRTVDNHIASLRGKIEPDPDAPRWIKTVHGVGYKLNL